MTLEAADTLGRTLKLELDSGRAQSRREAEEIVRGYVLQVDVGPGLTASRSRQIALLTVVNAARRAFPGGVHVRIADDPTMSIPWAGGRRLPGAPARDGGPPAVPAEWPAASRPSRNAPTRSGTYGPSLMTLLAGTVTNSANAPSSSSP